MTLAYEIENLVQVRSGREVLRIPSLSVAKGEVLGLTGPNGGGKTTLLRILAFLDRPAGGRISFMGRTVAAPDTELRRRVAMLGQSPYLLKRRVRANVAYGLEARGVRDVEKRVTTALDMVGLEPDHFAHRSWKELSGGEAQRVALAARLALEPEVLILDEPTTHLDAESAARILEAAAMARKRWGSTVIAVSHDQRWLGDICTRTLVLERGRIGDKALSEEGFSPKPGKDILPVES